MTFLLGVWEQHRLRVEEKALSGFIEVKQYASGGCLALKRGRESLSFVDGVLVLSPFSH